MRAGLSPALVLFLEMLSPNKPKNSATEPRLHKDGPGPVPGVVSPRFQGDAHKDTGCKTMTLVGAKGQGPKIISEEWSAH